MTGQLVNLEIDVYNIFEIQRYRSLELFPKGHEFFKFDYIFQF